jgi:hypothetical protein
VEDSVHPAIELLSGTYVIILEEIIIPVVYGTLLSGTYVIILEAMIVPMLHG